MKTKSPTHIQGDNNDHQQNLSFSRVLLIHQFEVKDKTPALHWKAGGKQNMPVTQVWRCTEFFGNGLPIPVQPKRKNHTGFT
jgi:hypothetical protein